MDAAAAEKKRCEDRVYLVTGLLLLASEIWKQLVLTFVVGNGTYQWSFIPFQLCSVPMYICLLIWVFRNTGFRQAGITFLADFAFLSGLIVFLDTTGMHYGYAPLTLHSYLWHFVIAGLGVYSGLAERDRSAAAFLPAAGIYLACCAAAEVINLGLDRFGPVNMFYINPHYYMNQIVFSSMLGVLSNNAVIAVYIAMTVAGAFLVHLLWMCIGKRKH